MLHGRGRRLDLQPYCPHPEGWRSPWGVTPVGARIQGSNKERRREEKRRGRGGGSEKREEGRTTE
jgi:hypothetical protein